MPDQSETQIITTSPIMGHDFAIQVTHILHETDVAIEKLPFHQVTDSIESIANSVLTTLRRIQPHRATVEFGIEIGVVEGSLLAIVAKGETTANMKITLEWEKEEIAPIKDDKNQTASS